ncbi:hypothetical protein JCM3770_003982 [Rhodotorula araucariae]
MATPAQSPRARRASRPLPFTMAMPPAPAFAQPTTAPAPAPIETNHLWDTTAYQPFPAQHYRAAVDGVQSVLYGGRGRDRAEISRLVGDLYDSGATFENPLTLARGKDAIADMFALLALVPGTMWSEMGDLTESHSAYDGNRLVVFTHTLHIALLPSLDTETARCSSHRSPSMRRSISFFSLPSTPYPQTPSTVAATHDPETPLSEATPGIFSKTHPAFAARDRWPAASLLSALTPRAVASALTTLHLKLHTRLLFNEEGRITAHEDLWGLKELVEGFFPVVGHLYAVNRQGVGWLARIASRALLGAGAPPRALPSPAPPVHSKLDEAAALEGGQYRTPRSAAKALYPGAAGDYTSPTQGLGGALGLDIGERAVATTLEDE